MTVSFENAALNTVIGVPEVSPQDQLKQSPIRADGDSVHRSGVSPVAGCLVPRGRGVGHNPMLVAAF
jgi:hypothetical protein